jgi:rhodanese-related sulfurtransferase
MPVRTSPRTLDFDDALVHVEEGGAFVDLRPLNEYLEVHVPGSLALLYEVGPGMAARARDCLPLTLSLVLLDPGNIDVANAAAALRGKGFTVAGSLSGGVDAWVSARGQGASTEWLEGPEPPSGTLLDVADPGASHVDGATYIPIETLWKRTGEVPTGSPVAVSSGYGIRAALAVGILERAGFSDISFWTPA